MGAGVERTEGAAVSIEIRGREVLRVRVDAPMIVLVMIHLLTQEGRDKIVAGAATPATVAPRRPMIRHIGPDDPTIRKLTALKKFVRSFLDCFCKFG